MQRLHSTDRKKGWTMSRRGDVKTGQTISIKNESSILVFSLAYLLFFLDAVQPWHTQTGYYSIFTVWLQCPLLLLRRYCRLRSFQDFFLSTRFQLQSIIILRVVRWCGCWLAASNVLGWSLNFSTVPGWISAICKMQFSSSLVLIST